MEYSLLKSNSKRGEKELKKIIAEAVPDLSDQYSNIKIDMNDTYLVEKVRCLHAFQIGLVRKCLDLVKNKEINTVDIGDSSGSHLKYLEALSKDSDKNLNSLSINLDKEAIERIRSKGLKAIHCRAEDCSQYLKSEGDTIFTSFEMLEHLIDPIGFLRQMATQTEANYFVITVPYVSTSRLGLRFIKQNLPGNHTAERVHIFELSPEDLRVMFKFSGWSVVFDDIYLQYPSKGPLRMTKPLWKKYDFEGFYGVVLEKNGYYSEKYLDW